MITDEYSSILVQLMLQAGPASGPAPELLQRLQSHGAVSALSHSRHALRQALGLLLHPPDCTANTPNVAIANGPRSRSQSASHAPYAPRSRSHGFGSWAFVARTGRSPSRRVLSPAAD